ncbi:restriction endonuclease subunit S [Clostridioides sp. ZZV14-6345]|uniref:restriction endonuclease subunit S n=1 Tax=Clostridioides sp. ZZV14-6345 TaxID=2811496 RepID=UPI001D11A82A|nr:restriction endonuclease subunit S [Clostridioides sp. ZZV14-6345]
MEYRLNEVFDFIRNGASIKQFDTKLGYPITRIETIANSYIDTNKMGYADIEELGKLEDYLLKNGDILMSHINSEKHLGKSAIYENINKKIIHGMNLLCLRPDKEVCYPKYLNYFFNSNEFRRQLPRIVKKSVNQASFSVNDLKCLKVDLPGIETQKNISKVLDKAQELIGKRKEQIEALDDLVKSRFIEMFGDPIINTKKFDMKKIKEISIYLKRGVSPKYVEQSNIKVINQKCIYWRNLKVENCKYYDENLKEKIEYIFLKQNDILINSTGTGTLGRCVKLNKIDNSEYIADSHVTVLRSISNNLNSDYFAALFEFTNVQDTIYRKCVNGSTNQIELSVSKLGEYLIMVPPIEFQNQFSEFVKQVDKLKLKIETNLKELEDNFNSLMQKAFK